MPASVEKIPLSVVIVAKNEAHQLGSRLAELSFANEIVVSEQGSADATAEVARAGGAKIVQETAWHGFGPQKNRALSHATQPWIFSLDADEEVTPELRDELIRVVQANEKAAFQIPRITLFAGQWIHHCGWSPDHVLRLFPRGEARFNDNLVHESLQTTLPIKTLRHPLKHFSYPSPEHYWNKLSSYSLAWAKQKHAEGKRSSLTRAVLSGAFAFVKSYVLRLGCLDGAAGLAVCIMQAQAAYGKYLTLYWMDQVGISPKSKQ